MGFSEKEIHESLSERKCDESIAIYFLLGRKSELDSPHSRHLSLTNVQPGSNLSKSSWPQNAADKLVSQQAPKTAH